ncbi:ATP-binding cassette domain-containing protein [Sediminispirochaeta bajacaliforniensis]|uniref:ATP-binding cassette domain-containing protein n=1 Tax=Sediminispirochaeta bajacaliforniensis TaxID=148 RepID=UPI00036DFBCB|nr:ATP-binding cassette domain-containing protein [Sediminispirochaeta bajacaliforniensis]
MITLSSVSKDYGSFRAVDNLSLEIKEGEITGLLGPNGAGKTTTMRMITGYFRPSSGTVSVNGIDVSKDPETIRSIIGYLPESPPLYGEMLTYDYLRYVTGVRKITDETAIRRTAEICGITGVMHKRIDQLSKGYKQRVGLAQAIIHDPKILILDEPTTGLDPNQIIEVRNLITEIGKTKTVILSTHILQEVEAIANRVVIINKGAIVKDDHTDNLRAVKNGHYTVRLALSGTNATKAPEFFSTLPGILEAHQVPGEEGLITILVTAGTEEDVRPALFHTVTQKGWTLFEMSREKQSLEAIFRELTTGGDHD